MNARSRNQPTPARRVVLEPNVRKIVAAIGFLVKEADRRNLTLTQYDIVKALFFADRAHLNNFGRPITYDNYVAMKHGPVPSLAYDMLKQNDLMLNRYGNVNLPWTREKADYLGLGCFKFSRSLVANELEFLSESDVEALSNALSTVKGLTFRQIRELTHGDVAYKEAWALVGDAKSNSMSLGLLFDLPDFQAAEEVQFVSQHQSDDVSDDDDLDTYLAEITSGKHSPIL